MKGQVAIITGGVSDTGRAVCLRFARHGARVTVADLNAEAAAIVRPAAV